MELLSVDQSPLASEDNAKIFGCISKTYFSLFFTRNLDLLFWIFFAASVCIIPAQYTACDDPYNLMDAVFLGLIVPNTLYTFIFICHKRQLLQDIRYVDRDKFFKSCCQLPFDSSWFAFFGVIAAGAITLSLTLGKTPNCRNPVMRGCFRAFMFVCIAVNSKFQFENMVKKRNMFDYIFYKKAIEIRGNYGNISEHFKTRFEEFKDILPKLHLNIQRNLYLDLVWLTAFYCTVIADHDQFHDSFSLSFTVIVMFCVNMGSSVINMVVYNRNIKYVSLKCEENLGELEVTVFWWKPEGDILIGYLFGLIYLGAEILLTKVF